MCRTVMLIARPTKNLRLIVDKHTVRVSFILSEEVVLGLLERVFRGIVFVSSSPVVNSSKVLLVGVNSLCDWSGEDIPWQLHGVCGFIVRNQSHLLKLLKLLERVFFLGVDRFMLKTDTVLIISFIILRLSLLLFELMVEVNAAAAAANVEGLVYLNDYYIVHNAENRHEDRG